MDRWLGAAIVDWTIIVLVFVVVARIDHPVAYVLAVIPLGSRQQALGALFHDAAHRLVSRRRATNEILGSLLAAWPLALTLGGYRRYHFAHHDGLGTPRDPELTHKRKLPQWRLPASPLAVARDFASDLVGGGVPHVMTAGSLTRPVSLYETIGIGTYWLAALAVAWKMHAIWIPALWIASVATVFWSGVRLRIWTEHLGTTRTHRIAVPWWLEHLIMPHDIGLHWEHHEFPGVPFWNLAKLRAALPGPIVPLPALLRAFLTSARLPSGAAADVIDEHARTDDDPTTIAAATVRLRILRGLVHVVLPLLAGVGAYVGFRSVRPLALAWAYALGALLALVWGPWASARTAGRVWIACAPLVAAGWELGQLAGVVPGTFDAADLVFGVAASLVAVVTCAGKAPLLSIAPAKAHP